jgi:hypothetical protein
MQVSVADATSVAARRAFGRFRPELAGPPLLCALLAFLALQHGGYYAESWGLPTAACSWLVGLVALLGRRQRLQRLELLQLTALTLLGSVALVSAAWASGGLGSVLPQAQLIALYVAVLAAVLTLIRRATHALLAIWVSLVGVSLVALGTRLFPAGGVRDDTSGNNRLYEPLGYWNSLGLWAAMGLCLGIVIATRVRSPLLRAAAAASTVPCAGALYFTFSRGAWVALAVGLLAALILDPRRLGLVARLGLIAPWPAAAVLLASRSHALTRAQPVLSEARSDGRSLAFALLAVAVAAALVAASLDQAERRFPVPMRARQAFAWILAALCLLMLAGGVLRFGAPWTIADRAAHRFAAPPPSSTSDLNARLFDASGSFRIDLWRIAWQDARHHPLVGSGAGSYASKWFQDRPVALDADNAHSQYLETLAELGPLGLALLLTACGAPLIAAWRARRHPLAAGATAAYVAFLVHAGVDWDWQLAAVSLAGLGCGAALLIMARGSRSSPPNTLVRILPAAAGVALAGFALWSLHGSYPLGQARDAADNGDWVAAESHAAEAVARVGGSSARPWQLLGEAQTARRKPGAALASLRVAVARDPAAWEAWYDLAQVAKGAERRKATAKALALNPLELETLQLARLVGGTPPQ